MTDFISTEIQQVVNGEKKQIVSEITKRAVYAIQRIFASSDSGEDSEDEKRKAVVMLLRQLSAAFGDTLPVSFEIDSETGEYTGEISMEMNVHNVKNIMPKEVLQRSIRNKIKAVTKKLLS